MILDYEPTRSEAIFVSPDVSKIERSELLDMSLSSIPGMNMVHWFALAPSAALVPVSMGCAGGHLLQEHARGLKRKPHQHGPPSDRVLVH
jgi:hypothetical protein